MDADHEQGERRRPWTPPSVAGGTEVRVLADTRRPARGWSRLVVAALGVLGVVIVVQAALVLMGGLAHGRAVIVLNALAGWGLILAAVCVAHNGRRMRMIGWMTLGALITGPATLGMLTLTGTVPNLQASVWADGGRSLAYLPLVLPVVAAVCMWLSDPRRIVATAGLMDELGQTWAEGRGGRAEDPQGGSPTSQR